MLVLTRRIGEPLMVGNDIKIVVGGIKGNQVKIAIEAPQDIPIHRQEIYERIKSEFYSEKEWSNPTSRLIKVTSCNSH